MIIHHQDNVGGFAGAVTVYWPTHPLLNQRVAIALGGINASTFDGSNDYLTRGAALTSATETKTGIISCWFKVNGGDGTARRILQSAGARFTLAVTGGNLVLVQGADNTNMVILRARSTTTVLAGDGWHHVLCAWDLANTKVEFFLDDTEEVDDQLATDGLVEQNRTDWGIGAAPAGINKFDGCLSELYFNIDEFEDPTTEANRRKFITADLEPADLGPTGGTPTGTDPIVYHPNPFGAFHENEGTGGDFSVTGGALEVCAGPVIISPAARLLLINPPGLDAGFGGGLSL